MKKKLYFIKIINAIQQGGNKFILVVSLIMGIAISNFANAQWYWQNPLPQGNTQVVVSLVDANTGNSDGNWVAQSCTAYMECKK